MFLQTVDILKEDKIVDYSDLSSSLIKGVNRMVKDDKGVASVQLMYGEKDDEYKKSLIEPYLNDYLYITSDLHLNHKNRNSSNFFNLILNDINNKIGLDNAILFNGDMGDKSNLNQKQYIKSFLDKINCKTKILILGNHDNLPISDWYDIGFSYVTDKLETDKYIFSHCPVDVSNINKINVHGHIHFSKEYFNMDWKKHIDVYIGGHNNQVLQLKDYLDLYRNGYYNGVTKQVDFNKRKE